MDNNEELGEKENISMTIHIHPKKPGPITPDERKLLAGFFEALMDLEPKEDKNKKTNQ